MTWDNLDIVHYEARVMSGIGTWSNFDELEESLSLPELFVLYNEVRLREVRQIKGTARAFGSDVEIDFGPEVSDNDTTGDDAFNRIMDNIASKTGVDHRKEEEGTKYKSMKLGYTKG